MLPELFKNFLKMTSSFLKISSNFFLKINRFNFCRRKGVRRAQFRNTKVRMKAKSPSTSISIITKKKRLNSACQQILTTNNLRYHLPSLKKNTVGKPVKELHRFYTQPFAGSASVTRCKDAYLNMTAITHTAGCQAMLTSCSPDL